MNGTSESTVREIVLVHGGFVDGSGWEGVYQILKQDGYTVSIVQNPTTSLEDDVAATRRVLATAPAVPCSWSATLTVAWSLAKPATIRKVAGLFISPPLLRITGESVSTLIKDPPPGAPVPPILPPQDGFLFLDKAKFAASFAADVDDGKGCVHG